MCRPLLIISCGLLFTMLVGLSTSLFAATQRLRLSIERDWHSSSLKSLSLGWHGPIVWGRWGALGCKRHALAQHLLVIFFFFLYHRAFSKVNSLPQFLIYLKWEKSKFCMTTNSILVVTFQLCQIKCIFKYTEPNILWENKTWISKTEILNNVQEQPSFTLLLLVTKILNLENVPETQWMIGV